ncbi:syntaphilin [Lampris incognitus]|uniref:syntaphilin n=1 Tax=Lampris incognitus TaxID=2546036 RepID=UPI0024B5E8C3|nr:syntaphilin [Lampris incognitus]
MSAPAPSNRRSASGSRRRTPAPPSTREPFGNASLSSSSNSGSCKGSDCSPTKGRHQKYTSCTDNHGIRPPPPEQYLTPLQQKEVCIRHLRARLKETIDRLQDRDTEIDELRGQLSRMQEDWIEEECHRVEAQLALKQARREIQQLKHAVDTVRASLSEAGGISGDVGVQKYFQDINTQNHKLENLLLSMELAQTAAAAKDGEAIPGCRGRVGGSAPASVSGESPGGVAKPPVGGRGSCSCDGSPARSLTQSSTYTRLSDQTLADRNGNGPDIPCLSGEGTQDSGFVCCGENSVPSRADLLLEAAFLSEETASLLNSYAQTLPRSLPNSLPHTFSHTLPHTMPNSSTFEKLCAGDRLSSLRCALAGVGSVSHPCLSHHHLYLHQLRETGIQTESCPVPTAIGCPSDLDTIAEQRTFRSHACSPTSTWMSDEGDEELDSITTTTSVTTATIMTTATEPIQGLLNISERSEEVKAEWREGRGEQVGTVECSTVGNEAVVEEAAARKQWDLAGLAAGRQRTLRLEGCTGNDRQEEIKPEELGMGERHQELQAEPVDVSKQIETEEVSPRISPGLSPGVVRPHTSQPRRSTSHEAIAGVTLVEMCDDEEDGENGTSELRDEESAMAAEEDPSSTSSCTSVQKSYWSRHFLVDLLAVVVPVVPTVAWFCRGPVRDGQPMYHIGSLLRGCCTVALHSLRRGGGLRHYPAGGGDVGGTQM